ncbi:DinB family protein [Clostridioides difficile]|nr:DinB family protein [Clostridioides difficile]MBY2229496.1 DinB family protein [Clostridioides difficile]SJO03683.1 DinB superfamily [Clostridioides difficile]SJO83822.1 DinB superfamily [Clostridioides difficile]HBF0841676.1 DinB family protein [Clostridioides difficile]HBF0845157.1 DinB family protein [Clostridioides difficile]
MKYFGNGLSEVHKELNKIIRKEEKIEQAKELFLKIHAKLHLSKISNTEKNEVDKLINDLNRDEYAIMPTNKDETIAWVLWHITRIEDLTVNMLVAQKEQIFNEQWKDRLSVFITDTGNALSDDEIMNLSKSINIDELLCYRNEVAKNTIEVVKDLKAEDMKRKVSPIDLERILVTGGVIKHEDSIWLLDFWGNKDIAGILLMPPTRHVILHLNDCCKWKEYFRTKKKFYRS